MSQDLEPGWTLLEIEPGNILGVYSFIVSDDYDGLRCLSMDHNHPAGPFKQFGSNSHSLFFMKCQLFVNIKKIFMTQKRQFSLSMIGLFEKSIIVFVKLPNCDGKNLIKSQNKDCCCIGGNTGQQKFRWTLFKFLYDSRLRLSETSVVVATCV